MSPEAPAPGTSALIPLRDLRRFSRSVASGDVIFEEGSPEHCMHAVIEGGAPIRTGPVGGEPTLNTLGPGRSFGEIALLEDGSRMAGAVATRIPTTPVAHRFSTGAAWSPRTRRWPTSSRWATSSR